MSSILSLDAKEILDSRGNWTIEVTVLLSDGTKGTASVPCGKSTGLFEAATVPYRDALKNIQEVIEPTLKGKDAKKQRQIDELLVELDGTEIKSALGANAMLGVSLAYAKAAAKEACIPLWKYIRNLAGFDGKHASRVPLLYINMINGGLHAGGNLSIQEYIVIPQTETISQSISEGVHFYQTLKETLIEEIGTHAINVGDEGGFSPPLSSDSKPLEILTRLAEKMGKENAFKYGIDVAASSLQKKKTISFYKRLKEKFNLSYIEDPFGENDFLKFSLLMKELGAHTIIAGDDLTTTNKKRIEMAKRNESINGIIIKPNQIGTLTETIEAVRLSRSFGWKIIVSHRSGETNDDFIADLAWAVSADGFKLGAPARGERIAKYNRLLEIEKEHA